MKRRPRVSRCSVGNLKNNFDRICRITHDLHVNPENLVNPVNCYAELSIVPVAQPAARSQCALQRFPERHSPSLARTTHHRDKPLPPPRWRKIPLTHTRSTLPSHSDCDLSS